MKVKIIILIFLISVLISCKKKNDNSLKLTKCTIDSIIVYDNPWLTGYQYPPKVYKFLYPTNTIREVKIYRVGQSVSDIQKFHFDNNSRLSYKEYFYQGAISPSSKQEFYYNSTGLLSGIKSYSIINGNNVKSQELILSYTGSTLSESTLLNWDRSDTSNPYRTIRLVFTGSNGNAEKLYNQPFNQPSASYKILETENLIAQDYIFLLDPIFELHGFFNEKMGLLPFLLNKKTTVEIRNIIINQPTFELRGAFNSLKQPISFSSTMAIWDYYYKNCP